MAAAGRDPRYREPAQAGGVVGHRGFKGSHRPRLTKMSGGLQILPIEFFCYETRSEMIYVRSRTPESTFRFSSARTMVETLHFPF
jgi:hypothetical protein